jgi:diacylglycerol kinase (ATP)
MTDVVLIANPCARGVAGRRRGEIASLTSALARCGLRIETCWTAGPGDATHLASRALGDGARIIIAAGGDGTTNEILQSIVGTTVKLAIWPAGTANVLARALALPTSVERAVAAIIQGRTRSIYPGIATSDATGLKRYFLLMAGIGLDASIVARVRPRLKSRLGQLAFWISGVEHLLSWHLTPFRIEIDGRTIEATFAAIGRAPRYGGELAITPNARLDQPEFEICIVSSRSRWRYLQLLWRAIFDRLIEDAHDCLLLRASQLRARGEAAVQVDGELIGRLPMSFTISASPVEIIVP